MLELQVSSVKCQAAAGDLETHRQAFTERAQIQACFGRLSLEPTVPCFIMLRIVMLAEDDEPSSKMESGLTWIEYAVLMVMLRTHVSAPVMYSSFCLKLCIGYRYSNIFVAAKQNSHNLLLCFHALSYSFQG
jgi:hypothetical protein